ncbi:MAG: hypothetical protein EP299_11000 [Acidobacteria bacterium]|nr:MAG: hypothetical protein EP299_11000 [Acidobacteriota bacterium]
MSSMQVGLTSRVVKVTTAVCFLISIGAAAARAQTDLQRLEVVLWPEYDRPALLVILRGYLPPDATLPTTVVLPIPATSTPHAVAKRDSAAGTLLMASYTVENDGDWSRVRIVTDMHEVRLEYYADLETTDTQRQILLEWPGGIAVRNLIYEIMQPVGASGLVVTPPGLQRFGEDGITYHVGDLGPIAATDTFSIAVSYTKTTPLLTAEAFKPPTPATPQMSQPPVQTPVSQTSATESESGSGANTLLVGLVVVLAAALVGSWVFFGSRKTVDTEEDAGSAS